MSDIIYLGRKNRINKYLTRNGQRLSEDDREAIQRLQIIIQNECFDTEEHPDELTYDPSDGSFSLRAGLREGLRPARRTFARVSVYDIAHPIKGLAWQEFEVSIVRWPSCALS